MPWVGAHYVVDHPRAPWSHSLGEAHILVHCRWPLLKGTDPSLEGHTATFQAAYISAKREFNLEVAFEIVEMCINDSVMDELADIVYYSSQIPILTFPHLGFDDEDGVDGKRKLTDKPTNALPFAFAEYLSRSLGCPVDTQIMRG
jgi:hypothetical protein